MFSGIGAHDYGLEAAGMQIVGQVEIDEFCFRTLKKHWPKVPKWRDIRSVAVDDLRRRCGRVDLVTGGFPCQDISSAGKQAGIVRGERSGLWREMWRIIRGVRPDWLLIENVPALRVKGVDRVLAALEAIGYSCWSFVVGAWTTGAPHKRDRVWIVGRLADAISGALRKQSEQAQRQAPQGSTIPAVAGEELADSASQRNRQVAARPRRGHVADVDGDGGRRDTAAMALGNADRTRREGRGSPFPPRWPKPPGAAQEDWEQPRTIESPMGSSTNGPARRLVGWCRAALKGIGNANPPQIPFLIGRAIMQLEGV